MATKGTPAEGRDPLDEELLHGPGSDPDLGGDLAGPLGEESLEENPGDLVGLMGGGGTGGEQADRRRGKTADPWTALVVAIRAPLTPGTYLRCLAYYAARPEDAQALNPHQQLAQYLELATYQHALGDEQRPEGERLYDWQALHMQGLKPMIDAEVQAQREEIAAETKRGTIATVLARISGIAPQNILNAIKELDRGDG